MDFRLSPRAQQYLDRVRGFVRDEVLPVEEAHFKEPPKTGDWTLWRVSPAIEALKKKARNAGLWNLFLPDPTLGPGLSTLEYAPLAEEMGRSFLAPEVFNCNAPDTGNMEVLAKYGTAEQKERWLKPLLEGRIRSAFCMTEPDVASSDATNLRASAEARGDDLVLNGKKWWITGLGHPRCEVALFVGVTDPAGDRHHRHGIVLVPLATKGVTIRRMIPVFGDWDAPYGHGEVWFENVKVPRTNMVGGSGKGFDIAQGRLGPGRIHHCMRSIGAAERALELLVKRSLSRTAFGKPLARLGGNRERIAELRIAIDQARLLTLHAAWKLDELGARAAFGDVSAIKVVAPRLLQHVADEAIQMFGGAGVSPDVPLTALFAAGRVLRIADGPDAVHLTVIARQELAKHSPKTPMAVDDSQP